MMAGFFVFIIGCIGCYFSNNIDLFMTSRFIQAFGGSVGSVLGQAICRDSFQGADLSKAYSVVGNAFPALGPLCGGSIAALWGWQSIFIFLSGCTLFVLLLIQFNLRETHPVSCRNHVPMGRVIRQLLRDKKVLSLGVIVGGCNGISFSYFSEGSFYLLKFLALSPSSYGLSFMPIALSAMLGGLFSKKQHHRYTSQDIMGHGLFVMIITTGMCSLIALTYPSFGGGARQVMIGLTILCQMGCTFGLSMTVSNALALALSDYKQVIGTASSVFGFFYYCLISLTTFFMGLLHNGTLLPMPFYFFAISCTIALIHHFYAKKG